VAEVTTPDPNVGIFSPNEPVFPTAEGNLLRPQRGDTIVFTLPADTLKDVIDRGVDAIEAVAKHAGWFEKGIGILILIGDVTVHVLRPEDGV
jgi:hypothetical protein